MKQQESNQFDKGMNLDLNVINIDNHTLTSALNATMITRNGNETVLQNDMGNAKVELAYLPSGYVPVGMKEFGGIVYVASYNPLKGTSQIGSFPSPETVINSDETKEPDIKINPETIFNSKETVNKVIDKIYVKNVLINHELKSGDKFQIIAEKSNEDNYSLLYYLEKKVFELRAIISGEDGENIDITNTCIKYQYTRETTKEENTEQKIITVDSIAYCGEQLDGYTLTDISVYNSSTDSYESIVNEKRDFNLYYNVIKGNHKGKLYLAQKLIVPDFIRTNLSISVNKNETDDNPNDEYILTFTPEAYKYIDSNEEDKVNWEKFDDNDFQYIITIENNSGIINTNEDNPCTINKGESKSFNINYDNIPDTQGQRLVTYTIKVQYPMGIVSNLIITDSIDLDKVADGTVEVSKFRYFNTIYNLGNQRSYIDFNYIIKPYLDNSDQITSLDLLYIERSNKKTYTKESISLEIKDSNNIINFETPNNYLGSYTFRKYFDPNFAIGKVYIGRLRIKTKKREEYQYSDPYIIVTSSTVNSYFFEHPNDSMFTGNENESDITFPVDCELEYDVEETELLSQDEPDENNTPNISTIKKNLYQYITKRTEKRTVSLTCNVKLKDSSLDGIVDIKFNTNTNNEFKKSSSDFNTTGGLTGQNVSFDDLVELNNSIVCTLSNEGHDAKIDIDLKLKSKSVFYGLPAVANENASDPHKFTYSNENATILMPYVDRDKLDELEMLFGGQILQLNDTQSNNKKLYPTRWISMNFYGKGGLYDTKTNKAGVKLSLVKNITSYVNADGTFKDNFGGGDDETLPSVDETTSAQTYVFGDSQTDTSVWNNHCTALNNYLQNRLNIRPSFLPWQASRHLGTNNMMLGHYSADGNIDYYSGGIYSDDDLTKTKNTPIHWNCSAKQYSYLFMKSTVDTWLLMVDTEEGTLGSCITYKNGSPTIHHGGSAIEFAAELFGNILVPKSGQTISYDYYKVSNKNNDYVYSNNYSTDVTGTINLNLTLTQNKSTGDFKFPKFKLNNDTYTINTDSKFNSFNQLEIDVDYISPSLMNFQNIAMVGESQITYATNPDNNSHEEINLSQPYLYYDGKIYKCKQTAGYGEKLKTLNPTNISTHIAAAICDRRIEMRKNEFNDIYELLINSNVSDLSTIKNDLNYSKKIWWLDKANTDSYKSRGIVQNKYQTDFDNSIKDENNFKLRGGVWENYSPMFFGRPTFMDVSANENGGYAGTLSAPKLRVPGQIACRESCLSATYVFDVVTNVFKIR